MPTSAPTPSLPSAPARLLRLATLWFEQCRAAAGLRRGITLGDWSGSAYYKELSAERLARALSPRGRGHKDYRVTFPDSSKLVIQCSRERLYADLVGPEGLARYVVLKDVLRTGMRVLEIAAPPMHTGHTAAWLTRAVALAGSGAGGDGESATTGVGGVVSINPDEQAVRFAVKRYPLPNLSIEYEPHSPADALVGETDGAFDAVVWLGLPTGPDHHAGRVAMLSECWRVLAQGGWLLAGTGSGAPGEETALIEADVRGLSGAVIVQSPSASNDRRTPDRGRPFGDVLAQKG
ncbi:MAG: class I SAM-dependent methyltransferase [Phycisphaerales bacterium]|nr:class I SAM-dependent methyltransferase [Phycisphaerales bacterium]